ncbi:MAG: Rieske 2Fe-2S domain-containing protein [Limnohabitans sp.]|jgi:phenylpropionate dioxygenase-like ring-hydroxylating dioxygenase large terminal subunit|uniref:Rieske 2Fe-2S domain-containing protein n=1 Tax=Limnohabitans sp. TaxID=1907725 RepID=UPI003919B2DE
MDKEIQWWWPLALNETLCGEPLAVHLLGQPLVLWRNAQGQPVLMVDRCPHRGARLSQGRIREQAIECPYHGWRFDEQGSCRTIPSSPDFQPPASFNVCRYPVMERHGLIWGALGEAIFAPPTLHDLPSRRLLYGPFDIATSAPRAVENFLDTAHFSYVHTDWLGDSEHTQVPHYEVSHTTDGRPVIEALKAWQPNAYAGATQGGCVTYRYEVLSPYSALLRKHSDNCSLLDTYVIWTCPMSEDTCRLWFAQYTNDTTSTDDQLRNFQVSIFSQDRPVLESQVPKQLPISHGELHCAADRMSVAYRRYLKQTGVRVGVC